MSDGFSHYDLETLIEALIAGQLLTETDVEKLCGLATRIFTEENNIVHVQAPVTVIGDLHGQFHDLIEIFRICGRSPYTNYLFLGDFADRGYQSLECLTLVLLLKLRYPRRITIIRGNHECRQVTQVYGFYDECIRKYGSAQVWKQFTNMFDYIPLVAIVQNAVYCVHGGLSPALDTLDQIRKVDRIQELPHSGPMADMLWSDPSAEPGWKMSQRGAGYNFGQDTTERFLKTNKMSLVVRGHQLAMEGYEWHHNKQLVTVFSAPNYCFRSANKGGIMEIDENLGYNFLQFAYAPHRGEQRASKAQIRADYFL